MGECEIVIVGIIVCLRIEHTQLRKKLFPEGTFPDSVALEDAARLRTEGENLPLQRGVKRPVSVRPPPRARQRRVPGGSRYKVRMKGP